MNYNKITESIKSYYENRIDFRSLKTKLILESFSNSQSNLFEKLILLKDISEVENFFPDITKNIKESITKTRNTIKQKQLLNESFKVILKEADETDVEYLDKNSLFEALTSAVASITEAFNFIYPFKNQYIENPNLKSALKDLRISLSDSLSKVTELTKIAGLENDLKPKMSEE